MTTIAATLEHWVGLTEAGYPDLPNFCQWQVNQNSNLEPRPQSDELLPFWRELETLPIPLDWIERQAELLEIESVHKGQSSSFSSALLQDILTIWRVNPGRTRPDRSGQKGLYDVNLKALRQMAGIEV